MARAGFEREAVDFPRHRAAFRKSIVSVAVIVQLGAVGRENAEGKVVENFHRHTAVEDVEGRVRVILWIEAAIQFEQMVASDVGVQCMRRFSFSSDIDLDFAGQFVSPYRVGARAGPARRSAGKRSRTLA